MAEQIAHDEWLCVGSYDLSGISANFGFGLMAELEEIVCFKPITGVTADRIHKKRLVGAQSAKLAVTGWADPDILVPSASANVAVSSAVVTYGFGRTLGDDAFLLVGAQGSFGQGGPVGKAIPYDLDLQSNGIVVPGSTMEFSEKSANGNGTTRQLGAVTASQSLYLHAHVVAKNGSPAFDLVFERSALGDYSDAVTVHTFSQFTGIGNLRAVVAGPITDTHYRFRWTLGGTGTPKVTVRLAAGIR